ncbi:DnaJ-domain-containing protein [Vararia minispora EC-137]|uniref:DnaJ-domain-containing protein n=1 Tax=Vararia minispora EC-137 TaxID=1314806 RepID=A0ACB8QRY1_9AGAM|nr:DnaJ-domain-containing protein [Vararia minispora EC-137]
MSSFPDYYSILHISRDASQDEIRQAYRKESLRTHPDRLVQASAEEKKKATEAFQAVADAYYVLSDPSRRKEYDNLYTTRPDRTNMPSSSASFFSSFASMFTRDADATAAGHRPDADGVFGDVFEDLLRPEVERTAPWWAWFGAACGAGLGFIVANVPGTLVGAYAGNRLGAIRDAKGKAVAVVFKELGGQQKAEILRALAMKVLGSAL